MRILTITNMYPSVNNKVKGIFVKKTHEQLNQSDFTVGLVSLTESRFLLIAYILFYLRTLFKLIIFRPDVVYCHFISHTGILALISKWVFRKKIILNCHGTDIMNPLKSLNIIHKLNLKTLRVADLIIVPSSFFKNTVMELVPEVNPDKFYIFPSAGIKLPKKSHIVINESTSNLGFVGNLVKEKGTETTVRCLNKIQSKVNLFVAGRGDENIFNEITNPLVNVILLGELNQNQLGDVYSKLDLLLFPTEYEESLGLTPIEAMSYSVPVIGTNIGAVNEYIKHGHNGYLIPIGDSDKLLEMIKKFTILPFIEKIKMCEYAREMSLTYDEDEVSKDLINRIKKL